MPKSDVATFSVTGYIYIYFFFFQTSHFAAFEQLKVEIYFANFGQVKIDLLYWVCVRHASKIDSNSLRLIKIQGPRALGSGIAIFNDPSSRNQELVSLVNKWALKVQSFTYFCNTFF